MKKILIIVLRSTCTFLLLNPVDIAQGANFIGDSGFTSEIGLSDPMLEIPETKITFGESIFPDNTEITDQYSNLGIELEAIFDLGGTTFTGGLLYQRFSTIPNFPTPPDNSNPNLWQEVVNSSPFSSNFSVQFTEATSAAAVALTSTIQAEATFTALRNDSIVGSFTEQVFQTIENNFYGFQGIIFDEIAITTRSLGSENPNIIMGEVQRGEFEPIVEIPEKTSVISLLVGVSIILKTQKRSLQ